MPELQTMEKEKTAGFVDRGYNHAKKQKRIEEEEAEIARLEAKERGEEEPRGKVVEDTQVQDTGDTQQEEAQEETKAQEDDSGLDAEEKSFKKRYGDLRRHMQDKEKEWTERLNASEKNQIKKAMVPPKSDEEIAAWQQQYPDVAGIVETIAAHKSRECYSQVS